jgi:hypothetical protein
VRKLKKIIFDIKKKAEREPWMYRGFTRTASGIGKGKERGKEREEGEGERGMGGGRGEDGGGEFKYKTNFDALAPPHMEAN